jgi:hypothetical protein
VNSYLSSIFCLAALAPESKFVFEIAGSVNLRLFLDINSIFYSTDVKLGIVYIYSIQDYTKITSKCNNTGAGGIAYSAYIIVACI